MSHRIKSGFTLVELLVVIAIIGILIALLLPAIQAAREAGRRMNCQNNLKQMGLACIQHESIHKYFPSGGWGYKWVGDPDRGSGRSQPGGWLYSILPYMEQKSLHSLGKGMPTAQKNSLSAQRLATAVPAFYCPSRRAAISLTSNPAVNYYNSDSPAVSAHNDYCANAGEKTAHDIGTGPSTLAQGADASYWSSRPPIKSNGVIFLYSQLRISEIKDGTSRTMLAGECFITPSNYTNSLGVENDQSWAVGYDYNSCRFVGAKASYNPASYNATVSDGNIPQRDQVSANAGTYGSYSFGSAHAAGCNFVFCDGSVQPISYEVDAESFWRIGVRNDGKSISVKDLQ